jgi:Protein of unknown function (DUF2924)
MADDVTGQIKQLASMSREQLLDLWERLYRKAAHPKIRRELMVPLLAYRIQEIAFGGLKPSTRAELRRIARDLEKPSGSKELKIRHRIRPGTRLVREWQGGTHEVVIVESGYEYRGSKYKSLSSIARQITGSQWSGPAFFGLNGSRSVKKGVDD